MVVKFGKWHWVFVAGYCMGLVFTGLLLLAVLLVGIGTRYDALLVVLAIFGPCVFVATLVQHFIEGTFEEPFYEMLEGKRPSTTSSGSPEGQNDPSREHTMPQQ